MQFDQLWFTFSDLGFLHMEEILQMYSFFSFFQYVTLRKFTAVFLAILIVVGIISGMMLGHNIPYYSLMGTALDSVSIVGLLIAIALPFLFTLLSIFLFNRFFVFLICFFRSFFLGYCVQFFFILYGSGAWLFGFLHLFSSCILFPVDIWLWLGCFLKRRTRLRLDIVIYVVIAIITMVFDYIIISKFLLLQI